MSFLMGIGTKAWGFIAMALTVVAAAFVALSKAKQAGRDEVVADANEQAAAAGVRMLGAAVESPKTGKEVADAARRGGF